MVSPMTTEQMFDRRCLDCQATVTFPDQETQHVAAAG